MVGEYTHHKKKFSREETKTRRPFLDGLRVFLFLGATDVVERLKGGGQCPPYNERNSCAT